MVLGPIVNLILALFYLLLGYITFKNLNEKDVKTETLHRILLKWMTSAVFFSGFWIWETFMPFIPTSFVKLPLGLWILMPQFYGEYTIYNLFSDLFEKLEYYFKNIRNVSTATIFGISLTVSTYLFSLMKKFMTNEKIKDFQNKIRELDKEINDELKLRKMIQINNQASSGLTPGGRPPINTKLMKLPTNQIYTPVGTFTRAPTQITKPLLTQDTNISEENEFIEKHKQHSAVKSSKNSRKNSNEEESKKTLANAGKASSFIDPKLVDKLSKAESMDFVTKEDFRGSRKSSKKNK